MKLLLDTHIFLWYISGDERLSKSIRESIQNFDNRIYLSVVSIWEAIVKYNLGKLPLPNPPALYLPKQRNQHKISSLELDEASVCQLTKLPPIHRDPFDRILICQAMEKGLTIVTQDKVISDYSVPILK
ncbi:type II toxin-antitoxin system VapC family toxin [candidate division KSB1 bacterium]|nr:type II toxin-antitoxin system VapC family toxin [candidate division KSB1 bacterium]